MCNGFCCARLRHTLVGFLALAVMISFRRPSVERSPAAGNAPTDVDAVKFLVEAMRHCEWGIRLVEGGHSPALLVCRGNRARKWFARGPDVPSRWFPKDDLDVDSFAFGILYGRAPDDTVPRKIGADAWFDRRDADSMVHEQTIRGASDEILTLVLISDPEMLGE
jgi:hypothetical protein